MPKYLSAGVSEGTERKCRDFADLQALHMRITRGVMSRNDWAGCVYHYIDLNAGPGFVKELAGSPVLFLENASADDGPWRAWFCERDERSARELRSAVDCYCETTRGTIEVMEMDHREAVPAILQQIRMTERGRKALGLVYADPNGTLANEEMDSIRQVVRAAPKIDVLLHLSATTIKRCRSVFGYPSFVERLASVGKRRLLIRRPWTDYQWTLALLTDMETYPEWKNRGFYDAGNDPGAAILDTLNLSAAEQRRKQLRLW